MHKTCGGSTYPGRDRLFHGVGERHSVRRCARRRSAGLELFDMGADVTAASIELEPVDLSDLWFTSGAVETSMSSRSHPS